VVLELQSAECHPPQSADNRDRPDLQGWQHAHQQSHDQLEANLLRVDANKALQQPSIFEAFAGSRYEIKQTLRFKSLLNVQDKQQSLSKGVTHIKVTELPTNPEQTRESSQWNISTEMTYKSNKKQMRDSNLCERNAKKNRLININRQTLDKNFKQAIKKRKNPALNP
jgi:hypothetical protein